MSITLNFEVKRVRFSVTQGEAAVLVNGKQIVQYHDPIHLDGPYGEQCGGYGSIHDDKAFVEAAMRQYSWEILKEAAQDEN